MTARSVQNILSMEPRAAAFVFDLDGTLVDSETLCAQAWSALAETYGVPSFDEFEDEPGQTSDARLERLAEATGRGTDHLYEVHWSLLEQRYRSELRVVTRGYSLAVAAHSAGLPVAVASNSRHHRVRTTLQIAAPALAALPLVGADDVRAPKPAPDVYLRAAALLNVHPQRCVAVEDSEVGARAAQAAGMRLIMVDELPD